MVRMEEFTDHKDTTVNSVQLCKPSVLISPQFSQSCGDAARDVW